EGPIEYVTPVPVTASKANVSVSVASPRFVSETSNVFVWPDPDGIDPNEALTGSAPTEARAADRRFSRPAPWMFASVMMIEPVEESLRAPRSAVLTMADRTSAALQSGCCPMMTAAEPARCGVAIEVPWKNAQHPRSPQSPGIEERTFTPGATTSGLTR